MSEERIPVWKHPNGDYIEVGRIEAVLHRVLRQVLGTDAPEHPRADCGVPCSDGPCSTGQVCETYLSGLRAGETRAGRKSLGTLVLVPGEFVQAVRNLEEWFDPISDHFGQSPYAAFAKVKRLLAKMPGGKEQGD